MVTSTGISLSSTNKKRKTMKPLTDIEAACFLGVKPQTLRVWRHKNIGPKFVRVSRSIVRYYAKDLEEYMAARTVEPNQPDLEPASK